MVAKKCPGSFAARQRRGPNRNIEVFDGSIVKDAVGKKGKGAPPKPEQYISFRPRKDLRCYEVLGIHRSSTAEEVRRAYRVKALDVHPDRPQGGHTSFLSVAEAFETLSDRSAREVYDRELIISDSQDGLLPLDGSSAANAPLPHDSAQAVCQALVCVSASDWARHIKDLSTQVLEHVRAYLDNLANQQQRGGGFGAKTRREEPREDADSCRPKTRTRTADSALDPVLKSAAKGMHLYRMSGQFWCAQICVGGLTIRSKCTKCTGTAADGHIALLAYKELLVLNSKNAEHSFENYFKRARMQAFAQNIDVTGDQFAYFFHKTVSLNGEYWQLRTPTVRDLDTALAHRREMLDLLDKGASRTAVQRRISRLRAAVKAQQSAWREQRNKAEQQLSGYIMRELEQRRTSETSAPKRRRLQGKQSEALMHFRLPWFGRFASQRGLSRAELVSHLQSLQECLQRSPHLQECVQSALQKRLEEPRPCHLALLDARAAAEGLQNGRPGSSSDHYELADHGDVGADLGDAPRLATDERGDVWVTIARDREKKAAAPAADDTSIAAARETLTMACEMGYESPEETDELLPGEQLQVHEPGSPRAFQQDAGKFSAHEGDMRHKGDGAGSTLEERNFRPREPWTEEHQEMYDAALREGMWNWTGSLFPEFSGNSQLPPRQVVARTSGPVIMEVDSD